jgi:hypothetical protein
MSGKAFVDDHVLLGISFDAARVRLERLVDDGALLGASEYAYGEGIVRLAEDAGPAAGLSWLGVVLPGDLAETPDRARLPLRWMAIGPDGAAFPAMDCDLTLFQAGETTTLLTLAGVYRLPGQAATGLDLASVRGIAAVTIRSFIARLACIFLHPAGSAMRVTRARPERQRP